MAGWLQQTAYSKVCDKTHAIEKISSILLYAGDFNQFE